MLGCIYHRLHLRREIILQALKQSPINTQAKYWPWYTEQLIGFKNNKLFLMSRTNWYFHVRRQRHNCTLITFNPAIFHPYVINGQNICRTFFELKGLSCQIKSSKHKVWKSVLYIFCFPLLTFCTHQHIELTLRFSLLQSSFAASSS